MTSATRRSRLVRLGPIAIFLVSWTIFAILFTIFPVLHDTDSYYHLAIGRLFAAEGFLDALPWARMSLMHEGFGDKELLFHAAIAPFAGGSEFPTLGGRLALATFNATITAVIAALGVRAFGAPGLFLPLLVYLGSIEYFGRVIRLRAELWALLFFLLSAWCAGRRRYRLLGLVAMLFTLGYTAFHALLGLVGLWFAQRGWLRRRWEWGMLAYAVLGVSAGLLLHPHFPHNLVIWKVQSIDFFQMKDVLDVGVEIGPQKGDQLLWLNLSWIVGMIALWFSGTSALPASEEAKDHSEDKTAKIDETDESLADVLTLTAAVFGVLYLLMLRFSTHFIPFATLALAWEMKRRGLRLGAWTHLPGRGRLPIALTLGAALLFGGWKTSELATGLARAGEGAMPREAEWAAFGRAVPPGAKVAAEWGSAHLYMFWAPQGAYLNVLDPVFMATPYPQAYRAQRDLFESEEPDVPLTMREALDSDYLALSRFHKHPELLERLEADPRMETIYSGYTMLLRAVPVPDDFVLDWRVVPRGQTLPIASSSTIDGWSQYPRLEDPKLAELEAYVDGRRLDAERCFAVTGDLKDVAPGTMLQLAPWGRTQLWIDGELLTATSQTHRALLSRSLLVPFPSGKEKGRATVLTCVGADGRGPGFFLRRMEPRS